MNINRKYINQPPPLKDIVKFSSDLIKLCRDFKEIFPQSQGWEITLREMMIEIDCETNDPFQCGMMFSNDKSMDKEYAKSLSDDIRDHIGRHLHRR